MTNIVIPMAGRGSRFAVAGYHEPKPFIRIAGRPMIHWVVENLRPSGISKFIFICLAEHAQKYPEEFEQLRLLCPACDIVLVEKVTQGAACTVLLARDLIDNDAALMIANSDQIVDINIDQYIDQAESSVDGTIMTFWSDDPKWSYCRLAPDGHVVDVVEKQVVSNAATVGIYNFQRGADFVQAADQMIARDLKVNGEFYVAPAYNQLIERGAHIAVYDIGSEHERMFGLGTPEDLEKFKGLRYYKQRCQSKAN